MMRNRAKSERRGVGDSLRNEAPGSRGMQLGVMVLCILSLGLVGVQAGRVMDGDLERQGGVNTEMGKMDEDPGEHQAEAEIGDRLDGELEKEQGDSGKQETTLGQGAGSVSGENTGRTPGAEQNAEQTAEQTPSQTSPQAPTITETGRKVVALTFDDGPSAATTPRLLNILQDRSTKVTFFVLGNMATKSPEIVKRQEAEGHEVASHTPYHHQLTKLTAAQIRAEGEEMDRIFLEILGRKPVLTRPPYGSVNATVRENLAQPLILWSVDPRDWADKNASMVCTRVVSAARNGSVILVHDVHPTTVDAVPCIIDTLRGQGYEFLTVSELARERGVMLVNGGLYYSFY